MGIIWLELETLHTASSSLNFLLFQSSSSLFDPKLSLSSRVKPAPHLSGPLFSISSRAMASFYYVVNSDDWGVVLRGKVLIDADIDYDACIERTKHDIDVARIDIFSKRQMHEELAQRIEGLRAINLGRAADAESSAARSIALMTLHNEEWMVGIAEDVVARQERLVSTLVEQLRWLEKERGEQWCKSGRWLREIWIFLIGAWWHSENLLIWLFLTSTHP